MNKSQPQEQYREEYKNWLFYNWHEYDNIQTLITSIKEGQSYAVSDGSYIEEENCRSTAWRFTNSRYEAMIEGSSVVPAIEGTNSSYRCEGTGILAILDTLTNLCTKYQISKGSITICCNNLTVIDNMATDKNGY